MPARSTQRLEPNGDVPFRRKCKQVRHELIP